MNTTADPAADPAADLAVDLSGFLLTQELLADPRSLDSPGVTLTWTEYPRRRGTPYQRTGQVLGPAPRAGAVWVRPETRRAGEGVAVVVDGAVGGAGRPRRFVGTVPDVLSSQQWQQVDALPRLWLRTDVHAWTHPGTRRVRARDEPRIHARSRCPGPPLDPNWSVHERGRPVKLPSCFGIRGWVHPLSVRPVLDVAPVPVCGVCVEEPPTTLHQPLSG